MSDYPRWDPASWPDWLLYGLLMTALVAVTVLTTIRSLTN